VILSLIHRDSIFMQSIQILVVINLDKDMIKTHKMYNIIHINNNIKHPLHIETMKDINNSNQLDNMFLIKI
jgi:hypothetical protein